MSGIGLGFKLSRFQTAGSWKRDKKCVMWYVAANEVIDLVLSRNRTPQKSSD